MIYPYNTNEMLIRSCANYLIDWKFRVQTFVKKKRNIRDIEEFPTRTESILCQSWALIRPYPLFEYPLVNSRTAPVRKPLISRLVNLAASGG